MRSGTHKQPHNVSNNVHTALLSCALWTFGNSHLDDFHKTRLSVHTYFFCPAEAREPRALPGRRLLALATTGSPFVHSLEACPHSLALKIFDCKDDYFLRGHCQRYSHRTLVTHNNVGQGCSYRTDLTFGIQRAICWCAVEDLKHSGIAYNIEFSGVECSSGFDGMFSDVLLRGIS